MKKIIIGIFLVLLTGLSFAQTPQIDSNFSLGFIKYGSSEVGNLSWHPDLKLGPLGLGLDINYPLNSTKPFGYENIVLRNLEYNDGQKGLQYGVLDKVTYGHGLLMKDFSTRLSGPIILNSSQVGIKGFYDFEKGVVRAMWTKAGVEAVRLEERINPMLNLGQSYVTDVDGVIVPATGVLQKVSGFALDATVPLPYNFEGYAEYAQLIDHGNGLSTGVSWGYDLMVARANMLVEYRMLDKSFVPGYFGPQYNTDPINLASVEATGNAKNGYLAQLDVDALGIAQFGLMYEKYNESIASLNANLNAHLGDQITFAGYYKQPNFSDFRSLTLEQGAMIGSDLGYKINPFTSVIVHYKKVYNPATLQVEESTYYELSFNL